MVSTCGEEGNSGEMVGKSELRLSISGDQIGNVHNGTRCLMKMDCIHRGRGSHCVAK